MENPEKQEEEKTTARAEMGVQRVIPYSLHFVPSGRVKSGLVLYPLGLAAIWLTGLLVAGFRPGADKHEPRTWLASSHNRPAS